MGATFTIAPLLISDELGSSDVARALKKHPSTVGRWLELAIRHERTDPVFQERLGMLDAAISSSDLDNATTRYVAP